MNTSPSLFTQVQITCSITGRLKGLFELDLALNFASQVFTTIDSILRLPGVKQTFSMRSFFFSLCLCNHSSSSNSNSSNNYINNNNNNNKWCDRTSRSRRVRPLRSSRPPRHFRSRRSRHWRGRPAPRRRSSSNNNSNNNSNNPIPTCPARRPSLRRPASPSAIRRSR